MSEELGKGGDLTRNFFVQLYQEACGRVRRSEQGTEAEAYALGLERP